MKTEQTPSNGSMGILSTSTTTAYHRVVIDGVGLFYREAGPKDAPKIVLLHGYPSSSRQFDALIPLLATRYHVIAPDYPGFGHSDALPPSHYSYTFDNLAKTTNGLLQHLKIDKYTLYLNDYGGPVGFRIMVAHPERLQALILQNANAYKEGLGVKWADIAQYWADPEGHADIVDRFFLSLASAEQRHIAGTAHPERYNRDSWADEYALLCRPGQRDIQAALVYDYRTNVESYPAWQAWLRKHKPRTLVAWGRNDPSFIAAGAEAFARDLPDAEIHLLDAGHFALDEKNDEIAQLILEFLARTLDVDQGRALFGDLNARSAPAAAKEFLDGLQGVFGFVPNLGYALASEPPVLGAYITMLQALGATSLDPVAQQVAMVAASRANAADYGIAVHSTLAAKLGAPAEVVAALRNGGQLADPKLEAVRRFAAAIASKHTQVSDSDVNALKAAGYDHRAAVAIALAAAAKTLVNTVAHLSRPEIDPGFLEQKIV